MAEEKIKTEKNTLIPRQESLQKYLEVQYQQTLDAVILTS